jgi:hypothetical protein
MNFPYKVGDKVILNLVAQQSLHTEWVKNFGVREIISIDDNGNRIVNLNPTEFETFKSINTY